jgi:hypothetical protein
MTGASHTQSVDTRAADLHARAIVVDGQAGGTILNPAASLAGGLTAVVITLEQRPHDDFTAAGKQIAKHLDLLEYYRDQVLQVRTVADIERAKREGSSAWSRLHVWPRLAYPGDQPRRDGHDLRRPDS